MNRQYSQNSFEDYHPGPRQEIPMIAPRRWCLEVTEDTQMEVDIEIHRL